MTSFIQSVQQSSHAVLSHAVPWHELLAHLGITPGYLDHPILDIMVTFYHNHDNVVIAIPDTTPICTLTEGANFKNMAESVVDQDDELSLRLEYNTECLDSDDVRYLERVICGALEGIGSGEDYKVVRGRLSSIDISGDLRTFALTYAPRIICYFLSM
jgi:hypothetical protein